MEEIFKSIAKFKDYQVSNFGRIKSFKQDHIKGKLLQSGINFYGHPVISLSKSKKGQTILISHLVLETFISKKPNTPNINASHLDCNKQNNNSTNLIWESHIANIKRMKGKNSYKNEKNVIELKKEDVIRIKELLKLCVYPHKRLSEMFNVSIYIVRLIKHNKIWFLHKKPYIVRSLYIKACSKEFLKKSQKTS